MRFLPLLIGVLSSCSTFTSTPSCDSPDTVLVSGDDPLTCATAAEAVAYARLLAGRPVFAADRGRVLSGVIAHYKADPADTKADLATVAELVKALEDTPGLAAAELRSTRAWEALNGQGPLDAASYPEVDTVLRGRIAVWASDAQAKLVLTEADIEGWISFASLCREVQAGGPLKLSIANRELLYRDVADRFEGAARGEQIGMVGVGAFWPDIANRWKLASYEEQQAWITSATLPPPMTATSLGYAAGVYELPFAKHAEGLHTHFGPLRLDAKR